VIRRPLLAVMLLLLAISILTLSLSATDAELYFSSDKNGQNRVTIIQEGDEVWIVVIDNDENIDCDIRDKFWTDVKLMDPKTGANIDWESWEICIDPLFYDYIGRNGCTSHGNFFEETGADTGAFVSNAAFQIGRRINWDIDRGGGHWVGHDFDGYDAGGTLLNEHFGDFFYWGDLRDVFGLVINPDYAPFAGIPFGPFVGWFENMDTLVGLIQDPNDTSDVAIAMLKIIDTEASITWDQDVYKDANGSAMLTVVDPDENVNCNRAEVVPVFILVNPGSWNPIQADSATTFCMLWRVGGVVDFNGNVGGDGIWTWNIYDSGVPMLDLSLDGSNQPDVEGTYYVEYPTKSEANVTWFDTATASGVTRVMFYARETGVDTGVFQLNLNSILVDLGFNSLHSRDVLAAYYLDPNDFDDLKVATATIEERQHSLVSFTDSERTPKSTYWIGHDPIYVQVVDANANVDSCCPEQVVVHLCSTHEEDDSEWWILHETGSNSSIFFSHAGMELTSVWNAIGVGRPGALGGYQLILDNWAFEAFNEDDVLVRYNDVQYEAAEIPFIGDSDVWTAFPPQIARVRVANDVSFDMMSVGDSQVFDGESTTMYFLDRQGNRISEYVTSDCVFIEVVDPDQDEDAYRRERIDGYWADVENAWPFAPEALLGWDCGPEAGDVLHSVNNHLGTTSIFNTSCGPKIAILNPRNGYWAAVDLLETGAGSGSFVSVACIDLASVHECVPTLGALPGDTLIASYQDPTNHSDSAWISIKVGIGGGEALPGQQLTTRFVDADAQDVASYSDTDDIYVKVIDLSHAGATLLANAIGIEDLEYDLLPLGIGGEFMTEAIDLDLTAGQAITATYTDPANPLDTSSDTIQIVSSILAIDSFIAAPNPFEIDVTFSYVGTGIASLLTLSVYDLSGHLVQELSNTNVSEIVWDGTKGARCSPVANGAYIYVVTATDGTSTFSQKGTLFVNR
jgi:hypothetical protein